MENTLKNYAAYLEEQELSEGTVSIYLRYANQIEQYTAEEGISKKMIFAYKESLWQRRAAPTTVNLVVIAVNKYLKYAGYRECTVKTERIQKRKSLENVLSAEDYRRMLEYARKSGRMKYYYIMKTLAQTGIRINELRYFTVEALEVRKIQVNSKGKIREIYLPEGLIRDLKEYCIAERITSGVIFMGNAQKPIGRASVYKMLSRIGESAGVAREKVYPHSFRHLFAVTYMNCYGNLTELADILFHLSIDI
ncbi:MAG: tyrosine-type recombinase/integrase [Dorea sp.]|nr:tyrosine-type recombinase/integrase [Dorea sp.]